MKDFTITSRRQKIEIVTFIICFIIAFGLNVYAIITYEGKWSELYSTIFYVLTFAVFIYVVWTIIRLIFFGIKTFINNKK